jgi:hypothetical protein
MFYNLNHKAQIILKVLLQLNYKLKVLMEQKCYQKVGLKVNKIM